LKIFAIKQVGMKKLVILSFFMVCGLSFAQDGGITGKILDADYNEEPLAFAQVKVQGLDIEVMADEVGNYNLDLLPGLYTLEIGFIGYDTQVISNIEVTTEVQDLGALVLESNTLNTQVSLASKEE